MTFSIILIRPQMGENIGAAARVMKNFGFSDLRIVNPRDGWPNPAAESMAAGGLDVVQHAKLFDTTRDAIADLHSVYATTARPRDMQKPCITSHELTAHVRKNCTQNEQQKIGIIFGPERSGLENEDIALADCIVSVPVAPEYPSLNLAQTVALIVYELSKCSAEMTARTAQNPEHASALEQRERHLPPASKQEIYGLFDHLESELDARNFWKVPEKKPQMWINIRNLLIRAQPTDQEVRTLRGIIRCLSQR